MALSRHMITGAPEAARRAASHPLVRMGADGLVGLRRFPFPYQAAFTIDNDVDRLSADNFLRLYEHLTTTKDTDLGPGLGLPLSSSFFATNFSEQNFLSLCAPGTLEPGPHADLIAEYAAKGYLDTLHAYGNYPQGGFARAHAERCLELMDRYGLKPRVWSNHGNANNVQNIKAPLNQKSTFLGDEPASPAYHLDLLKRAGARFFWVSLGGHSNQVGCDTDARKMVSGHTVVMERVEGRNQTRAMLGEYNLPLMYWDRVRDGGQVLRYMRYNGGTPQRLTVDTLGLQFDRESLSFLADKGGTAILYQHLGMNQATGDQARAGYWSPAARNALAALANFYRQGVIYVDTLSRLLNFCFVQRHLAWQVEVEGDTVHATLPARLAYDHFCDYPLEAADLAGQSFWCPQGMRLALHLGGRPVELVATGQDGLGMSFWQVPLRPLPTF